MISEQQIQTAIIDELRAFIGGPGSLRWPSHELLPALASATGRLCALTLRSTQDIAKMFEQSEDLITHAMRERFTKREPALFPLVDIESVDALRDQLLLQTATPRAWRKPSHLVVGALVAVLAQLTALRGAVRMEVLDLIEQARAQTPEEMVREFQRRRIWQGN